MDPDVINAEISLLRTVYRSNTGQYPAHVVDTLTAALRSVVAECGRYVDQQSPFDVSEVILEEISEKLGLV